MFHRSEQHRQPEYTVHGFHLGWRRQGSLHLFCRSGSLLQVSTIALAVWYRVGPNRKNMRERALDA